MGGGGPDKTILLSAARHDKKKFFILVTYLKNPDDVDFQIGLMGANYGIPNYIELLDRSVLDLKCLFQLSSLVKKYKIDIIHVHDLKTTILGAFLKLLNPQVKIMHTAHGWIINSRLDSIKQQIQYQMLKLYPLHIAVSNATKNLMIASGINEKKIKILYNSIDTSYWRKEDNISTLRKEYNIPQETPVIGTVGRLSIEKDIPTFLNVAQKVLKIKSDSIFFIVGDGKGPIVNDLKKLTKKMGIDKSVIFTGHRTDLKNIYGDLDVFLMTSLTEGLPNTVLEAMAMEVPVVATSVGGLPELIDSPLNGFLYNPGNSEEMAEKIIELLLNKNIREKITKKARERILNTFSFETRLKNIEKIYLNLVSQ